MAQQAKTESRAKRGTAWALCLFLALTVLPLVWIGRYNYPSWDDFSWAVRTRAAASESGFGLAWFEAVGATLHESFFEHYGNFSGLLTALQPDVWTSSPAHNPYFFTSLCMLAVLLGGLFLFARTVSRHFGGTRADTAILFALLSLPAVQFCPSPLEAFYWYTGAVSYTVGFALFLSGIALVLRFARAAHSGAALYWRCALVFAAAYCTCGVTYLTPAFSFCLALVFVGALCLWQRAGRKAVPLYAYAAGYAAGFLTMLLSPGAQNRLAGSASSIGALSAVVRSFFFTGLYVARWLNLPVLAVCAALCVLFWPFAAQVRRRLRLPGVVTLLSYCFLSTLSTPVLFGVGGRGSGRVFNVVYWTFLLLLAANLFYWLCWLRQTLPFFAPLKGGIVPQRAKAGAAAGLVVLFLLGCLQWDTFDLFNDKLPYAPQPRMAAMSAAWSLATGEAQQYAAERQERLAVLLNPAETDPVFSPISAKPWLLYYTDLDQGNVAGYYGKHSITVLQEGTIQP